MNKSDLKDWTREMLESEIINMNDKNFSLQNEVNNLREQNGRLKSQLESETSKIKELQTEIEKLKELEKENNSEETVRFKLFYGFKNENGELEDAEEVDYDLFLEQLLKQHEKDFQTIEELHTALDVMCDKYSRLRESMEMD